VLPRLLIFDFDGVIADSETLACGIAATYATDLGAPMSAADGLRLFMGRRVADVAGLIAERGGKVPINFASELEDRTLRIFETSLEPIPGVEWFLEVHRDIPRCIASSSSHARLAASLDRLGFADWFKDRIFSVDDVERGKPFPDLFLHAARVMQTDPTNTLVIEDSVGGVTAGAAAGMQVVGLVAGTHLSHDHSVRLLEAGAAAIARSYADLSDWMAQNQGVPVT
jgi:HAD superfamily hydrolase (TIGR01509 family)